MITSSVDDQDNCPLDALDHSQQKSSRTDGPGLPRPNIDSNMGLQDSESSELEDVRTVSPTRLLVELKP